MDGCPAPAGISEADVDSRGRASGRRAVGVPLVLPDPEVPKGHSSGQRGQVASAGRGGAPISPVTSKCRSVTPRQDTRKPRTGSKRFTDMVSATG